MPIANTVEANIVVNFEDRLTGPSQKAFEQFRKHTESTFRAVTVAMQSGQFIASVESIPVSLAALQGPMFQAGRQLFDSFASGLLSQTSSLAGDFAKSVRDIARQASSLAEGISPFAASGPDRLIAIDDNPLGLNLEPQFEPLSSIPSFASGIGFVPRDMVARIHKGETVLPRKQAEEFRQGNPGGGGITFNITGNLVPDQATARKFARMIEDERQRLNERRSA